MIKGALGWFVTILGLFIISIGLVFAYRIRLNYENKNSRLGTLSVQSVSYGVLLTVLGILVVYYWDLIASPIFWFAYIIVTMLLGLLIFYSPPLIKL